jgi:hypothetical protein
MLGRFAATADPSRTVKNQGAIRIPADEIGGGTKQIPLRYGPLSSGGAFSIHFPFLF